MTIGRANSFASETRNSVSWNVERAPNSARNCFGRTSREAGHSLVPAPPHMISGTIRLSIEASKFVVVAIPHDKFANAVLDRGLGPEPCVAHQSRDVSERFRDIARLHRQHILYRGATQLALQKRDHVQKFFRMLVADVVQPRGRVAGVIDGRNVIDEA